MSENSQKRKTEISSLPSSKITQRLFYDKGMFPPQERIEKLVDQGSFFELGSSAKHHCRDFGMEDRHIPYDGVITGFAQINGRKVCVYAQDFSAMGGTYGEMHGKKICQLMDLAAEALVPVVGMCHSGGLRLQETLGPMKMFGELFKRNSIYSGVIPQISVILGVVAGGQAYSPGLTDFIFMTERSSIYIAGPAFVKAQTSTEVNDEELGGAAMHSKVSGLVDVLAGTEEEIFDRVRALMDLLPSNWRECPPSRPADDDPNRCEDALSQIVPREPKKPFDMHGVIDLIFDSQEFFEMKSYFAKNMITGFSRLGGNTVGVVANQPSFLGGVIDIKAAEKGARFVRFCDAFNIPIITFQDSPAFMIGREMEEAGMIYRGAKLLHAYAEATVPMITVIVRKAYAGAYIALGSKYIGADFVYAWPNAEISSVSPKTAGSILLRENLAEERGEAETEKFFQDYYENYVKASNAASLLHIDEVIDPGKTRPILIKSLKLLKNKTTKRPERKHGNIPL